MGLRVEDEALLSVNIDRDDRGNATFDTAKQLVESTFGEYVRNIQARLQREKRSDFKAYSLWLQRGINQLPGKKGMEHANSLLVGIGSTTDLQSLLVEITNPKYKLGFRSRMMVLDVFNQVFNMNRFDDKYAGRANGHEHYMEDLHNIVKIASKADFSAANIGNRIVATLEQKFSDDVEINIMAHSAYP